MDLEPLSPPGLLQPLTRAVLVLLGHLPPAPHPTPSLQPLFPRIHSTVGICA